MLATLLITDVDMLMPAIICCQPLLACCYACAPLPLSRLLRFDFTMSRYATMPRKHRPLHAPYAMPAALMLLAAMLRRLALPICCCRFRCFTPFFLLYADAAAFAAAIDAFDYASLRARFLLIFAADMVTTEHAARHISRCCRHAVIDTLLIFSPPLR